MPGPFRDTDTTSNKCRSTPRKLNKLVLVDRNSLPLLSPGTWIRHNVGHALDSCVQWDTVLPGPRGRLPSGHVGGCSDPLVSKPQFSPMSLFGDLFQSQHGKFHLALATGPTCYTRDSPRTVSHGAVYCGTWVAPARCQLSRIPLCLGKAKSEQLRVEWGPTKPTPTPYKMHTATGSTIARKPGSSLKLAKCPWLP